MRPLTLLEKKQFKAGFAAWNFAIGFSLVSNAIIKIVELATSLSHSKSGVNLETNQNSFDSSYYGGNPMYLKLSKYPSKTNATILM